MISTIAKSWNDLDSDKKLKFEETKLQRSVKTEEGAWETSMENNSGMMESYQLLK